jgi:hypothetical protein
MCSSLGTTPKTTFKGVLKGNAFNDTTTGYKKLFTVLSSPWWGPRKFFAYLVSFRKATSAAVERLRRFVLSAFHSRLCPFHATCVRARDPFDQRLVSQLPDDFTTSSLEPRLGHQSLAAVICLSKCQNCIPC